MGIRRYVSKLLKQLFIFICIQSWCRQKFCIHSKYRLSTNICSAAHHIVIINQGAVPHVLRCFCVLYKYIMTNTIFCCGRLCFFLRTVDTFQRYFLYYWHVLKSIILFEVTYTFLQRCLWIGCLFLLLPLLPSQIIRLLLNLDSDSALVFFIDNIMNCGKSHIDLSRWHPSLLLFSNVPGEHVLICIILNVMVTVKEKCNSFFLFLRMFYDMQCAQPFTHCLTYSINLFQNNCSRIM